MQLSLAIFQTNVAIKWQIKDMAIGRKIVDLQNRVINKKIHIFHHELKGNWGKS